MKFWKNTRRLAIFSGASPNFYKKQPRVRRFNDTYENFAEFIKNYNREYVAAQKQLNRDFFDNIEGKSLDDQQRQAIITDEYSNLIIAGAGSGKTLTILESKISGREKKYRSVKNPAAVVYSQDCRGAKSAAA